MCLVTLSDVTCPHGSPETGFGKGEEEEATGVELASNPLQYHHPIVVQNRKETKPESERGASSVRGTGLLFGWRGGVRLEVLFL